MSKLNLNPNDTLQNAAAETYTEKELLNCLESIWKNRMFITKDNIKTLNKYGIKGDYGI